MAKYVINCGSAFTNRIIAATELGDALAWACNGGFPVGDYDIKNSMGVHSFWPRSDNNC
jgi:hypothetical protein